MFSFKKWSLTKKLLISLNVLSVLLMAGLTMQILNLTKTEAVGAMDKKMDMIASVLNKVSGSYIWNLDIASLDGFAQDLIKDADIDYVNFYDKDGKNLTKKQETPTGHEFKVVTKDIPYQNNEIVGKLEIGYNYLKIDEDVKKSAKNILLAILAVQVILSVSLFFVIRKTTSSLIKSMDHLRETSGDTYDTSKDLKTASQDISMAGAEQASAVQETVATLDQITAMVQASVTNANRSSELGESSLNVANEGKKAVDQVIRAIEEINVNSVHLMEQVEHSNARITEIIDVIKGIAEKTQVINDIVFQTKLLSFNASVEAARAGEHGKGFAVVAEEVGNLARMSGTAANEISEMLQGSISKVQSIVDETKSSIGQSVKTGKDKVDVGIRVANDCGKTLEQVVQNVTNVRQLISEIAMAANEQAQGVNNISQAMTNIDQASNKNAATSEATAQLATALAQNADSLKEIVHAFEKEILGYAMNDESSNASVHQLHQNQHSEEKAA